MHFCAINAELCRDPKGVKGHSGNSVLIEKTGKIILQADYIDLWIESESSFSSWPSFHDIAALQSSECLDLSKHSIIFEDLQHIR